MESREHATCVQKDPVQFCATFEELCWIPEAIKTVLSVRGLYFTGLLKISKWVVATACKHQTHPRPDLSRLDPGVFLHVSKAELVNISK